MNTTKEGNKFKELKDMIKPFPKDMKLRVLETSVLKEFAEIQVNLEVIAGLMTIREGIKTKAESNTEREGLIKNAFNDTVEAIGFISEALPMSEDEFKNRYNEVRSDIFNSDFMAGMPKELVDMLKGIADSMSK